ncbi:Aa_trans-domain-containing protein [Fragilariopsis cylindrus CCMP1102]|uniref:Aa_trans-domain-containing protein n=1 Tax=Fragilariopsis cylindrus CCMP1102 TaxID=635003 RepID=A0A1E7FQW3_9STRA|nr:Aa_trans-domain-containing protein [Fragilariopsis cylindrus CCMP1102]|eukprot:OEU20517.1 Aa_trans-domain-containing protein [Fragilariopsis cylindrus CCMP1102]
MDKKDTPSVVLSIRGGGGGGGGKTKTTKKESSIVSSVFNLVNNVAGAGILTLASGVAPGTGVIPAIIICFTLGTLSGHCFSIIGDACELTGESDFKGLWMKTIGPNSAYMVDTMIAIMCLSCSVIYSGILGDVFTPLFKQAGFPDQWNGRSSNIIAITIFLLLPLSLIKDLSKLAFTSLLGFSAILYTVFFIIIRAFDGSYKLPAGKFLQDGLITVPSMWNFDFTSLVLASNLGLAYIAHYNAPNFYRSLKDTNSKRFRLMVNITFITLVTLYIATMMAGYATFGDICQGNILLNYHPNDILSTFGRLATGFSILFGFPLVVCGAREAIIGLTSSLANVELGSDKNNFFLVAGILTFVTAISCTVKDVSLVVGLTGAALGSTIVYVCPPLIYTKAVTLIHGADSTASKRAQVNLALVPFGLFIAVLGCFMTIKEAKLK